MKKQLATFAIVIWVALGVPNAFSEDKPAVDGAGVDVAQDSGKAADKPSVWMRMKLKSTEGVLHGLAAGDFDAIAQNAKRMNAFSHLERLARGKNDDYQLQLRFFRYANRELIRKANAENLDGATMAFMQLTTSCVNCHRAIRDAEAASGDIQAGFEHVIRRDVDYYITGPQQSRPPEGRFAMGTKVKLIQSAGNYSKVENEQGVVAYVSTAAVRPVASKSPITGTKKNEN